MQARYAILVDDVERSLYSTLPPRLSREQEMCIRDSLLNLSSGVLRIASP